MALVAGDCRCGPPSFIWQATQVNTTCWAFGELKFLRWKSIRVQVFTDKGAGTTAGIACKSLSRSRGPRQ